jgi:hypothetical protein
MVGVGRGLFLVFWIFQREKNAMIGKWKMERFVGGLLWISAGRRVVSMTRGRWDITQNADLDQSDHVLSFFS